MSGRRHLRSGHRDHRQRLAHREGQMQGYGCALAIHTGSLLLRHAQLVKDVALNHTLCNRSMRLRQCDVDYRGVPCDGHLRKLENQMLEKFSPIVAEVVLPLASMLEG